MHRIDQIFSDLRARGQKTLMPFVTAGDPDLATTESLLGAFERAGATVCELGIPFSDPIADGPVMQASMAYALQNGIQTCDVLEMVARCRQNTTLGLVAMVSFSIVYRLGAKKFFKEAKSAGIDGLIIPDLPLEESPRISDLLGAEGLTCTMLIAPTTSADRAERIVQSCTGFVYLLARSGLTGEQKTLAADLPSHIRNIRSITDLPIVVGFGISNAQQVREVTEIADGAIVASAIMRRVGACRNEPTDQLVTQIQEFVTGLAEGLDPTGMRPTPE